MPLILIVDDDTELASMLVALLRREGWEAEAVHTAADGARAEQALKPALVLLDLMLPDGSGLELCRYWHRKRPELRIMMLTARGGPFDRALGLDLGADDYLAKPFEKHELLARVRALLRRQRAPLALDADIQWGALTVHVLRREVTIQGRPLPLSSNEFKLLIELARQPGVAVSRDRLSAAVQAGNYRPLDRAVDMQVARLRKRLTAALPDVHWIDTVRGEGYAFVPRGLAGSDAAPLGPR